MRILSFSDMVILFKKHCSFLYVILFFFFFYNLLCPISTYAVTANDVQSIIENTPFYDPNASSTPSSTCGATTTGSSTQTGGPNIQVAFQFFVANGYTPVQSAGIVGNLWYESGGVNPTKQEGGGGGGYGIAQFTGPTLTSMRAWVTAKNEDPNSLQGQLDYLLYALNNSNSSAGSAVKATTSIPDATETFMRQYERPLLAAANQSLPARINDAAQTFTLYGSSAAGTTSPASCAAPVSCEGGSVTGDAAILCVAKLYNGIYYAWGGAHNGYANFRQACPITAIATAAVSSTTANPGPCATDCSGLVSVAVDQAFNQTFDWSVSEGDGTMQGPGANSWHSIPIPQVQAGDIVTLPGHVEIVDHYDAASQTVYTFGSHYTGTKTSQSNAGPGYYAAAYHWTGAGS